MEIEKEKITIKFTERDKEIVNNFYKEIMQPFCKIYFPREVNCGDCPFYTSCVDRTESYANFLRKLLESKINES